MESTKGQSKPKSKLKALLVLAIIIVAAVAGGYYYWETRPNVEFNLSVSPQFFHVGQREGKSLNVSITRSQGFTGQVQVSLMNAPSWVVTAPQTISGSQSNATLPVFAAYNAPTGSIGLTIVATSPGALDQSSQVEMKVVSVQHYTSINGNATIYDTTKGLDAETKQALLHYANGTLTFSHETPLLQNLTRGDVLVAGASPPVAPLGFFRLVLSVTQQNGTVVVQTTQATILDAVQEIHVHTSGGNSTGGSSGSLGVTGCFVCVGNTLPIIPETTLSPPGLPLNWGAIKADASVSFGAGVDYQLDVSLHWPNGLGYLKAAACFVQSGGNLVVAVACGIAQVDDAHFYLDANAGAEGDITGTPGTVNAGPTDLIPAQDCSSLGVPNSVFSCISPIPLFSIGPVGINLGVGFRFVGGATGQLTSNMYVKVSQQLSISIGPEYSNGQFNLHSVPTHTATDDATLDTAVGSNDVKLYAGPEITVSVDADAGLNLEVGLSAALHAFLEFQSQIPHNPVWWVNGGLEGCVGVNVSAFLMGSWNPPQACGTIVSAQIFQNQKPYPPLAPVITSPTDGATMDLSNPAFVNPSEWDFKATVVDPQYEDVTCTWSTLLLGQIGQSTSPSQGGCDGQIDVAKIYGAGIAGISTIYVRATATNIAGLTSPPSNPVAIHLLLPTPILLIQYPTPTTSIYQNQPFTVTGTATLSSIITPSTPNGVIDLCAIEPKHLAWFSDPPSGGSLTGCSTQMTIPTPGTYVIYFALANPNFVGIATDHNGNPIEDSVTVTVQAQTSQPPPGTTPMSLQIVTPSEPPNSPPHTPTSNPTVQLQGTLTGGKPPYTVTWQGTWDGKTATIATGFAATTLNYPWTVCTNEFPWFPFAGTVIVTLSATDSSGQSATAPKSISINANCEVTQAIQPILPATGLVTLLTLTFTVTGDRATVLKNRSWLPRLAN